MNEQKGTLEISVRAINLGRESGLKESSSEILSFSSSGKLLYISRGNKGVPFRNSSPRQ